MINFQNVSFRYDETESNGISNINLRIGKGEFILLSGRSGCGKTTLTRCINGLIPHFYDGRLEGKVFLNGRDISKLKLYDIAGNVGSVFQDPRSQFFTTDTVSEVAFACENDAIPKEELIIKVDSAIKELGIEHLRDKNLFELSSGERQRVAIASVHAKAPDIYVFDEPSANLDAKATEELRETLSILKSKGATVVISEHRLYYLKNLIDRVIYMENGRITGEYTKAEFLAFEDSFLSKMGLRCLYQEKLTLPLQTRKAGGHSLQVQHIYFNYKKTTPLLSDICLEASKGEVIGIIGENGAGKSTLAELLCGFIKEQQGSISIDAEQLKAKKRIPLSYFIMQDSDYQLFSESVADELILGLEENEETAGKIDTVLDMLDLTEFKDKHPASLSGGQKQRVVIATAYIRNLKVAVFDEPTSGLDAENMKRVGGIIQDMADRGTVAFVITHDYELLINACQRVIHIQNGKIADDFKLNSKSLPRIQKLFHFQEDYYVSENNGICRSL